MAETVAVLPTLSSVSRLPPISMLARNDDFKSHERAEKAALAYGMTIDDILHLTPKFWDMHRDPVILEDSAAYTYVTMQYNLCAGTIVQFLEGRPDLVRVVDDLLKYKIHGRFLLTEVGHGLDTSNVETTATLLDSGDFVIHSPTQSSAKFMAPTFPSGKPCVGVVFARLIVAGEDRGIRPFVVPLTDGKRPLPGGKISRLPARGGTEAVDHAIHSFHYVRVPSSALLGRYDLSPTTKTAFTQALWRIPIGSIALGTAAITLLQTYATIGVKYSLRRQVGAGDARGPIIKFRTQQIPILTTIAQTYMMEAFARWAIEVFCDGSLDSRVRHGLANVLKTVMVTHVQSAALTVSDRCGAQGLFNYNQMTKGHTTMRGISVAEGDILVLSIRLATELLQGRYELPRTTDPTSILARHEAGLIAESRAILLRCAHHRSEEVNRKILPNCQLIVEAIGHRMAYDAAVAQNLDRGLIDLYVASVMKLDPGWYIENAGLTRSAMMEMEAVALDAVLPKMESYVDGMGMEKYVTAPIVSDEKWNRFLGTLETVDATDDFSPQISGSHLYDLGRVRAQL